MQNNNLPSWFNSIEYSEFLQESSILFPHKTKTEKLQENFLKALLEVADSKRTPIKAEKKRMRPEVDPSKRERDRKREDRRQDGQTNIMSQIIIVKNVNSNKVEIILKTDFDKAIHSVIKGRVGKIDKGDVSRRDLTYYSGMENFINTKTSIKLLGKIEKAGKEKKESKGSSSGESSGASNPPPPPTPRSPKNGKEITDEFSTYPDWDHNVNQIGAILPDAFNTLSGKQPPIEYQQSIDSSRTLGDSINRIVKEIAKTFPEAASMQYTIAEPQYPTGQLWNSMGIPAAAPNVNLVGVSENGTMGITVKIGEQIRPGLKGEAGLILNSIISAADQQGLMSSFNFMVKDFIEDLRQDFSKSFVAPNYTTQSQLTHQGNFLLSKEKYEKEFISNRQKTLINNAGDLIEQYVNDNLDLKSAFLLECLTGSGKFEGQLGSAQVMLSANKDGTNAKIIPLNAEFMNDFADSSDTELSLKFQAKPNASGGFLQSLLQKISTLNEGSLDAVVDIEKMKDQFNSPLAFMQAFEIELADAVFKKPLVYSDFYNGDSDTSNTITIDSGTADEHQINIPVKYSFDQEGDAEDIIQRGADALMESYLLANDYFVSAVNSGDMQYSEALTNLNEQFSLFERNYRREYDNYQGKPEQRANRSKRVLARRKMIKKGKVRKGDGKDVNHKDGNPQNNSMNNLEPMSASKNRAIHEDHGAGFEGTPELVLKLSMDTPHSANTAKKCKACKTYSEIRKKKKKK